MRMVVMKTKNALKRGVVVFHWAFLMILTLAQSPSLFAQDAGREPTPPRLVLQITVDQLRGDLSTRYYERLGKGGFRYLWENGTVYTDAHHAHANTETIVGHTTLATGAHPSAHGMVANIWLDRESGKVTYNIEDPRYRLLTEGADVDEQTEIDPTQRAARSEGRSPSAIMVTTISDELAINTGGRSKQFAVSVKDRGAVSMAGHSGKAFWFSKSSGEFVTSTYYYQQYPEWVTRWNAKRLPAAYSGKSWTLLNDPSTYLFSESDDRPWETDLAGFGRVFPHKYGPADGKYFSTLLTISPAGDELTLSFAKELISNEQMGEDEITDYLGISFSATDYVGHVFGPSSLEMEDCLLRLDRVLADLFVFIDEQVGLANTLIVLSSDHGGSEAPGFLNSLGIPAGYVDPDNWDKEAAIKALKKKFGVGQKLIQQYAHPYIYLNHDVLNARKLDPIEVERAVALELSRFPGVALAVSSSALKQDALPDTPLIRSVLRNFNPKRSGDIFVVFEPGWFINDFDGLVVATTHGSPWRYDSYVPVVFAGPGISAQTVHRRVYTVDVAPTVTAFLGVKPPSGSVGMPLIEVLNLH